MLATKIPSHSPGCDSGALQAKALIVSSVDVLHQLVHVGGVTLAGHFQSFLERLAARQQAAKAQERATSQTDKRRRGKRKTLV